MRCLWKIAASNFKNSIVWLWIYKILYTILYNTGMQNVKMSGIPIYKNFGKKIEKIKQIAENSCGCIKNKYNEKQEK